MKNFILKINRALAAKKILFTFFLALAAFFCACDTPALLESKANHIYIFRYVDESSKDLIITARDSLSSAAYNMTNGIVCYPKLKRDEPYFKFMNWEGMSKDEYMAKYSFDICELATEEKVIALHGHYYIYYPYVNIGSLEKNSKVIRDGKWTDICDGNPLDLPILCEERAIYSEIRTLEGFDLDKITKKKRNEMTIDDIVNALNKVIDEGKLDKYSLKFSY